MAASPFRWNTAKLLPEFAFFLLFTLTTLAQENCCAAQNAIALESLRKEEYAAAAVLYDSLLEKRPNRIDWAINRAIIHERMGERGAARKLYEQILKQDSAHGTVLYNLALLEYRAGNLEISQHLLQKLLNKIPSHTQALMTQVALSIECFDGRQENLLNAEALIEQLPPSEMGAIHYYRGLIAEKRGKVSLALYHYRESERYSEESAPYFQTLEHRMQALKNGFHWTGS